MSDLPWGRGALAIVGYLVAVLVAVAVAMFVMLAPMGMLDQRAWEVFPFGVMITFALALPGFLLTLFIARRAGWVGWLPYACAGVLDVVVSWTIFDIVILRPGGISLHEALVGTPLQLLLPSLPGGLAGGFAYWVTVRRSLPSNKEWFWS